MEDKNIYKRLFQAKKSIGKISKDSTNPFFKSKYFDVNGLLEHVEPILLENGLMVLQPIDSGCVVTMIVDSETGESVKSAIVLPNITDPQKLGSAITYYRRYTLQSLLGLQAEDDDGNSAVKQIKKQSIVWLTEDQFNTTLISGEKGIRATLKAYSTDTRKMKKEYKEQLEKELENQLKTA